LWVADVMLCFAFIVLMVCENWFVVMVSCKHLADCDGQCRQLDKAMLIGWLATWAAANLVAICVFARRSYTPHEMISELHQSRMPDDAHVSLTACKHAHSAHPLRAEHVTPASTRDDDLSARLLARPTGSE
jgi:hypothetical protein